MRSKQRHVDKCVAKNYYNNNIGADHVDDDDHGDYLYFDNNLNCAGLTFFLKVSGSKLCTLLRASVMSISLKALIFSLFRAPE